MTSWDLKQTQSFPAIIGKDFMDSSFLLDIRSQKDIIHYLHQIVLLDHAIYESHYHGQICDMGTFLFLGSSYIRTLRMRQSIFFLLSKSVNAVLVSRDSIISTTMIHEFSGVQLPNQEEKEVSDLALHQSHPTVGVAFSWGKGGHKEKKVIN